MTIISDEYDKLTGLRTRIAVEDGQMRVNYEQDTSAAMERNEKLRNAEEYSKTGIKNEFWHVAHIPDSVCLKMMVEDGFDAYKADAKELMSHLRKHRDKYGHLFVTAGKV